MYYHKIANTNSEIWNNSREGGEPTFHLRLDTRCFRVTVSRDAQTTAGNEFYMENDVWLIEGFDAS